MAQYALIDGYLEALRSSVAWHRDAEDVVAEAKDHLYSTVAKLRAEGFEVRSAEQVTLQRFGRSEIVAAAFAASPTGGLAVPTVSTQKSGRLAILCALLWPVALSAWWIGGALEPLGRVTGNVTAVVRLDQDSRDGPGEGRRDIAHATRSMRRGYACSSRG